MRNPLCVLAILALACSNTKTESASSDSLAWDTTTTTTVVSNESITTSEPADYQTYDAYNDSSLQSEMEYESKNMVNDAWKGVVMYAGEYKLESNSEAEDGSTLTLTHIDRFVFNIAITKMVADFCSGTIESEIDLGNFPTATFESAGHPVTITFVDGKIDVQDPERQLAVGLCDYNGTFIRIPN